MQHTTDLSEHMFSSATSSRIFDEEHMAVGFVKFSNGGLQLE